MAGWQDELAALLRELGVTQEEEMPRFPTAQAHEDDFALFPMYYRQEDKDVQFADAAFWGNIDAGKTADDAWMDDLGAMRRDVESIVAQLVHLLQHGRIDPAVKEDVMIVLRALRRRATATEQAGEGELAHIESVAAMLHFCRLVLRLNEVKAETEDK
jgi:hypothetical protein